ncbi:PREDICTED: uncharacterized protein LOC108661594 [Theobroma cacao]|uniref:Uncharacterized protein LOC108661594 n=1 Tax=Theobroma cacao TaxID=3641 RepID=A0AB32W9H7_THECC|nr:PREDICTED: uncharacterized protein LOC108661594 [Theobroma cacao]
MADKNKEGISKGNENLGEAIHTKNTSEIWVDFQERFTQGIALRVYELKRAIMLLQQEKVPISTYYGKLKALWNKAQSFLPLPVYTCGKCICGVLRQMQEMREEEKVFNFLMGLDESYKTVCSQILSLEPLSTIGWAYVIAAQEEKQLAMAASLPTVLEKVALTARNQTIEGARHGSGQKIGDW